MKLQHLELYNFGGYEGASLRFAPVTVICGLNDNGKSTIGEAIRYALTGRARGIDGRGAGADGVIRSGRPSMGVKLTCEVDGSELITTRQKARGKPAVIAGAPATDPDVIQAVLDAPYFLALPAARQAEILLQTGRVTMTTAEILAEAEAMSVSAPAREILGEGISARLPAGVETVAAAVLDDLYKSAYEQRAGSKKSLREREAKLPAEPPVEADDEEIAALEAKVSDARNRAAACDRAIAERHERQRLAREAEGELARVNGELAQMGPAPEQGSLLPSADKLGDLRTGIAEGERATAKAQAQLDAAVKLADEAKTAEAGLRGALEQAEAGSTICDGSIASGRACPLAKAPDAQAISVLRQQVSAAQQHLAQAQSKERTARTAWQQATQETTRLRGQLQDAEKAAAKSEGAGEARRAELEHQRDRIAAKLEEAAGLGEQIAEWESQGGAALAAIRTAEDAYRAAMSRGDAAVRYQADQAAIEALRADVEVWEELVPALEPRGILARILARKLSPFTGRVNALLARLSEYRIQVRAERGVSVEIVRPDLADPLPPERLSRSAQLRLGVAIGAAISIASGLRLLVVDEVDALIGELRANAWDALTDPALGLDSVVIILSREDAWEPEPGEASYWIERFIAMEVVAQEVAS